jgi:hypothetical protein
MNYKYLHKKANNSQRNVEELKKIIDKYNDKKFQQEGENDRDIPTRLMLGTTGLGMVRGNIKPILAAIKGNQDLWHGSNIENLLMPDNKGILNEGLDLRYAGIRKRLNSALMKNAPLSLITDHLKSKGRKLSDEDIRKAFVHIDRIYNPQNIPDNLADFGALSKAIDEIEKLPPSPSAQDLQNLRQERIDKIRKKLGRRLYNKPKTYELLREKEYEARRQYDKDADNISAQYNKKLKRIIRKHLGRRLTEEDYDIIRSLYGKVSDYEAERLAGPLLYAKKYPISAPGKEHIDEKEIIEWYKKHITGPETEKVKEFFSKKHPHVGYGQKIIDSLEDERYSSKAKKITERYNRRFGNKKFVPLEETVKASLPSLAKKLNIDPKELIDLFEKNKENLGARIYFGTSPESVAFWAGKGTEQNFLQEKIMRELGGAANLEQAAHKLRSEIFRLENSHTTLEKIKAEGLAQGLTEEQITANIKKQIAEKKELINDITKQQAVAERKRIITGVKDSVLDQFTGGYYSDWRASKKYGEPEEIIKLKNLDALKDFIGKMDPAERAKYRTLMQFSTPTSTIDSMKDFPVVRRLIQSSPGLKQLMGTFLPQSDPSKDLSITENVPASRLKTMDFVDEATGKLKKRIMLEEFEKAPFQFLGGKGNRLKTLGRLAVPTAITGLGAKFIYDSLRPNKGANKKLIDEIPDLPEKKASVDPKTVALLLGVPTAVGLGLGAIAKGGDKLIGRESYAPIPKEIKHKFTEKERNDYANKKTLEDFKGVIAPHAANSILSAGATLALPSKYLMFPTLTAAVGGGITEAASAKNPILEKNPEAILPLGLSKIPGVRDFVKDNSHLVSGGMAGLTVGALPALAYIVAKKYYPYSTYTQMETIKNIGKLLNDIPNKKDMKLKLKAALASMVPGMYGLLGGAASAGIGYGVGKGINAIDDLVNKKDN